MESPETPRPSRRGRNPRPVVAHPTLKGDIKLHFLFNNMEIILSFFSQCTSLAIIQVTSRGGRAPGGRTPCG